jgi:membrane associated rhomboid family serine protease
LLIPLGHERMSSRRWPVVTFTLIGLNILIFLGTNWTIGGQSEQLAQAKLNLLRYAAKHPELAVSGKAEEFVKDFQKSQPALWKQFQQPDVLSLLTDEPRRAEYESALDSQAKLSTLSAEYEQLERSSILDHYAFIPAHPNPLAYLTANFLHGGWLHLIGNMWFLWLAGFVLEDAWGRAMYTTFYLIAGAIALQFYAWTNPSSIVPTLGASGAVAALMGAFLIRFPKLKIEMGWLLRFRLIRFKMAAYWLLPLWLLLEVFYGTLLGSSSGVAHWAHVGGFVFGAVAALGMKASGVEEKVNRAVEEQVTLKADPEIAQASELLDARQYDGAIQLLQAHVAKVPASVDGYMLLQQAYMQKGDTANHKAMLAKCCELHFAARAPEAAWQDYVDFLQAGGKSTELPAATALALTRMEENENPQQALTEYTSLAKAHADKRDGLLAQMAAARLCMKANQPQDALKWYEAAKSSPVPHLDWDHAIDAGIREAKAALGARGAAAGS